MDMAWSEKYKRSINCNSPKGFSQRAHCQSKKLKQESWQIIEDLFDEDLRKWFGKGKWGGKGGGGWDRYSTTGKRLGKCGGGEEGDAYAACLSSAAADKLGKKGVANFVKRKRSAQKAGGDAKKGGEKTDGDKPIRVSWDKTGKKSFNPPN